MGIGTGLNVLLVEDNDDIREGLVALLDGEGYSVTECPTAEEGLARMQERSFHLIVTDYMLPGRSGGWMLDEAIRAGLLVDSGILMITAHPKVTAPPGARMLHKPLDIDEFLAIVQQVIEAARAARQERMRQAL